jgi:hypothetical protein
MEMPEVRCSVANCTYWAQGGACTADKILVEIDAHANRNFSSEIGEIGDGVHRDYAKDSSCTMCHTFKPRSE